MSVIISAKIKQWHMKWDRDLLCQPHLCKCFLHFLLSRMHLHSGACFQELPNTAFSGRFLLQAEGARGKQAVHNFQLCASNPWRAPQLFWKRITSSSWCNSAQSKAHFKPLFNPSGLPGREGIVGREAGRLQTNQAAKAPHPPLACVHFICDAAHMLSKDLLHFTLLENQKTKPITYYQIMSKPISKIRLTPSTQPLTSLKNVL